MYWGWWHGSQVPTSVHCERKTRVELKLSGGTAAASLWGRTIAHGAPQLGREVRLELRGERERAERQSREHGMRERDEAEPARAPVAAARRKQAQRPKRWREGHAVLGKQPRAAEQRAQRRAEPAVGALGVRRAGARQKREREQPRAHGSPAARVARTGALVRERGRRRVLELMQLVGECGRARRGLGACELPAAPTRSRVEAECCLRGATRGSASAETAPSGVAGSITPASRSEARSPARCALVPCPSSRARRGLAAPDGGRGAWPPEPPFAPPFGVIRHSSGRRGDVLASALRPAASGMQWRTFRHRLTVTVTDTRHALDVRRSCLFGVRHPTHHRALRAQARPWRG